MKKFNAKNLRREVQKQLKELRGGVGRKTEGQLKIEKVAFEREQIRHTHGKGLLQDRALGILEVGPEY